MFSQLYELSLISTVFLLVVIGVCLLNLYFRFAHSQYGRQSDTSFLTAYLNDGARGEFDTGHLVERALPGARLFFNAYLPLNDGYTELDVVAVHTSGCYVFESKNYSGWIFGNSSDIKWTQSLNRHTKCRFYNPIRQNSTHVKVLAKESGVEISKIIPVVVFSERCELKKLTLNFNDIVLKRSDLSRWLSNRSSLSILDDEDVSRLCKILETSVGRSNEFKLLHANKVAEKNAH